MENVIDRSLAPKNEPARAAWRRPPTKVVAAGIVAALLLAGGVAAVASHKSEAVATPVRDVPRREGDAIEVSEAFRAKAGIGTESAARAPLTPLVKVVGTATFDPTHLGAIGTRAPGIVRKVFHVEGDTVERGEVLAEIESPALATAQADLRVAGAKRKAAELNEAREKTLLERSLTTAREYEQAHAASTQQEALAQAAAERVEALGGGAETGISQLKAPVAGLVAERAIAPGQSVEPGFIAFRVGDLDSIWVLLRVFERHIELVRQGDAVEIRKVSDADSDEIIHGTVAHVGAVLDPASRTADVRVAVANENRALRPGQAVEATIRASGPARVCLSVPKSAITFVDGSPTLFVAETPTRFVARSVETGLDSGDRVEIVKGLREGEAVVNRSVLALKSELFR